MAAVGDVFEVKLKFRDVDNKEFENVFFYRYAVLVGLGNPSAQETLANVFNSLMVTAMLPTTPFQITYHTVAVRNLFNGADAFDLPILRAGTRTVSGPDGNLMPSFNAAKVVLATDNGLVKKGRKMLAGLLEVDQASGIIQAVPYALWATRVAMMVIDLVDSVLGGQKSFWPIVVKRVRTGTPKNYVYRLPENNTELIYGSITNAIMSAVVTTQNSRKD